MLKRVLALAALLNAAHSTFAQDQSTAQPPTQSSSINGIFVGEPKVYDDRSLQLLLNNLRTRLAQLSGLDQASLINKLGTIQGATASTLGFSMQASGTPLPGVTTTASQATPTTTQTTGGTTSTTPSNTGTTTIVTAPTGTTTTTTTTSATTATTTASNQTVVAAPGSTSQTQVTSPAVTPVTPSIANAPSFSMPSAFSPSALDVLGEQMQLSYEIINLQLLLEGSMNDQYVKGTYLMKPHSTLGFPISIAVPSDSKYHNAVAEVEITVCDPPVVDPGGTLEPPSLMALLPREKTYNVASIVNKSVSLGASGIIAGVINVGGNFLWGRQTYYVVEDQDTVALEKPPRTGVCEPFQVYNPETGQTVKLADSKSATFAWQFRPVLGRKVVRQGLRQTFAQISFPTHPRMQCTGTVTIKTRWLRYDPKRGILGNVIAGSESADQKVPIAFFFPNSYVRGVTTADNFDGTMSVTVSGGYMLGTRVRVGSSYLDESTQGFQNSVGNYIRFTAPEQLLALNGASLVTRDGVEDEILADSGRSLSLPPCASAEPPKPGIQPQTGNHAASGHRNDETPSHMADTSKKDVLENSDASSSVVTLKQYSDALIEVTVPIEAMRVDKPGGPYPAIVLLGGKAFGLNDAPFKSVTDTQVTFLAAKDLVRSDRKLTVKRLFLQAYQKSYPVPSLSDFAVFGVSVLSSTKDQTSYALLGSGLNGATVTPQPKGGVEFTKDGTVAFFSLSADQSDGLKQLVVRHAGDTPVLASIPDSKGTAAKPQLSPHDPIGPGTDVSYVIKGTMLDSIASIRYLDKPLPFSLALDKKSLTLKLPNEMTSSVGIRLLLVTYADGSTDRYPVTVGKPK